MRELVKCAFLKVAKDTRMFVKLLTGHSSGYVKSMNNFRQRQQQQQLQQKEQYDCLYLNWGCVEIQFEQNFWLFQFKN